MAKPYPNNISEAEFLDIVERIVNRIAMGFRFGYHDVDDIKQMGMVFALEGLKGYDGVRPLENYLRVHIRNRLINKKRDTFKRNDPPCKICHTHHTFSSSGLPFHSATGITGYCKRYSAWRTRNLSRQAIMNTCDIDGKPIARPAGYNAIELKELLELIDLKLPVELRATLLKMRAGLSVPRQRREAVEYEVRRIIK